MTQQTPPTPRLTWMLEELVDEIVAEAYADPAHPVAVSRLLTDVEAGTARHLKTGVVALPPGFRGTPHTHDAEELNICLRGSGTITMGDQEVRVEPGTVLWSPAEVPHVAHVDEDGDVMVLVYGYAPGAAPIVRLTPPPAEG